MYISLILPSCPKLDPKSIGFILVVLSGICGSQKSSGISILGS
jgi:hypothetical protein